LRGGQSPSGAGVQPQYLPESARALSVAVAPAAERGEDGGAERRLNLFLGHFGTHRASWRCVACEGDGFDDLGPCQECCGWGWFLCPEILTEEAISCAR